jgi:hypothetical protein
MKTNIFLYIITGDAVTGNTFDAHYPYNAQSI